MAKKLTQKEFIIKARKVHGYKYSYDKSVYVNTYTKVVITCPAHGDFEQAPSNHISTQKQGCKKCYDIIRGKSLKLGVGGVIKKFRSVHGDKYDYSKVVYKTTNTKVVITCPLHGDFEQTPKSHKKGCGCDKCAQEARNVHLKKANKERTVTFESFKKGAEALHKNCYSYDENSFKGASSVMNITCKVHGAFTQRPHDHLKGNGCPSCAVTGFKVHHPAILYYLEINGGQAYKIGVTNKTVNERFYVSELKNIKSVFTINLKAGSEALKLETSILRAFKSHKYIGEDLLSSGNTELFNKNIFENLTTYSTKSIEEFINEYFRSESINRSL